LLKKHSKSWRNTTAGEIEIGSDIQLKKTRLAAGMFKKRL